MVHLKSVLYFNKYLTGRTQTESGVISRYYMLSNDLT